MRNQVIRYVLVFTFLAVGNAWAGPKDENSLNWAVVKIGGVSKGAVVDSGGFNSVSYVDAIAMGILNADGSPKNPPSGSKDIQGVQCDGFDVSASFNPAKATPKAGGGVTLSSEGTEETTTTKVYVPRKSEPDDKRKTIPTKLGRGIVGTAYNGRRLIPWDFGPTAPGSLQNIRGSKWASVNPPPQNIPFTLRPGQVMAGVSVDGVTTSANLTFLPTTMISPGMAHLIGFTPTGVFSPDLYLQQSLFTDGFISAPVGTQVSLLAGFAEIVLPSAAGPFDVGDVAVVVDPELSTGLVLGTDALIPPFRGGYLTSDMFYLTAATPEPSTLTMWGSGVLGVGCFLRKRLLTQT
jgi:hypothetical protein